MAASRGSKVAEWITALREWLPTVRVRFNEWVYACQAEPRLIWQTPAIRYASYGVGALLGVWVLSAAIGMFTPGGREPQARASTADFHVICTNPQCARQYVIERKFKFDDFPVECPHCRQRTGQLALKCYSPTCRGAWVAAQPDGRQLICSRCRAVLKARN